MHEYKTMNTEVYLTAPGPSDRAQPDSPKRKLSSPQRMLIDLCIAKFCPTMRYDCLLSPVAKQRAAARKLDPLGRCNESIIALLRRQCEVIQDHNGDRELAIKRCIDLMEMAHEKFYAFPFKAVPACWLELYREASLLKFTAIALTSIWGMEDWGSENTPPLTERQLDDLVQTIDNAHIMSGRPRDSATQENVNTAMDFLEMCHIESLTSSPQKNGQPAAKRRKMDVLGGRPYNPLAARSTATQKINPRIHPSNSIRRVVDLPVLDFSEHMKNPRDPDVGPEPIIIKGAINHWPALNNRAWSDPEYLMAKTIGGRRLVPIETGKSYVDALFGQKIMKFKDFLDQYVLHPESSTQPGYLAQHDLFSQIPSLREDIMIPDYCFMEAPGPHPSSPFADAHSQYPPVEEPLLNAWFGPAGTDTPLHTDPYHNILAQVVGRKYIRLYAPRESKNLYAKGREDGIDMSNTSEMDVGILAGLDGTQQEVAAAGKKFPLAKNADFVECVLEEGECLYIPIGWWHYVRSLSVSFSVSFWFN